MIKVECVTCKAPYELDPRRIPDKGMKMRCPKCGASFVVSKDGNAVASGVSQAVVPNIAPPAPLGAPRAAAPAPIAPPFVPPAPPKLGVAPPAGVTSTVLGHKAPAPVPAPIAPAVPAAKFRTALGVAPPAGAPASNASTSDRAPAGSLAPPPGSGPAAALRPALASPFAPAATSTNKAAAAKAAFGGTMLGTGGAQAKPQRADDADLPTLRSADPAIEVKPRKSAPELHDLSVSRIVLDELPEPALEVDLPAPRAQAPAPVAAPRAQAPAPVARAQAPAPRAPVMIAADADLPAPKMQPDPKPKVGAGSVSYGDLDLPAPKADLGGAAAKAAPAPAAAPRAVKPPAPVPKLGGGGFGDLDLPAPKAVADLPAPKNDLGAELPSRKGGFADLPATKGLVDLPAAKNFADLPAARDGADLPAPRHAIADLPTPRDVADLPALQGAADLPSPATGTFGDLDLPVPRPDLGFGELDLPAHKDDLPVPKHSDESSFADLDMELPDLPPLGGARGGFGDLPPPRAGADLVPPKAKTVQGMGGRVQSAADHANFGNVALEGGDSDLPPSLLGEDESNFSDLEFEEEPAAPRRPAPPAPRARTGDVEELEPDAMEEDEFGGDDAYEGDFGEAEFQEGAEGEAAESGEDMEFGISGEDGARGMALPPEVLRRQRGQDFEAKQAARGKRTLEILVRLAVGLILAGGAGAALTFTEYGVFGIYYWERWLPEASNANFARAAIERAEKVAASDTFVDARRALKELGEARHNAGLNRELLTRSWMHQGLFMLRFGGDTNIAAQAAAIAQRLEERSWRAPGVDLARAADAARRKQWREAEDLLASARREAANDPYADLLAGEIALAENKLAQAEKAFTSALQHGGGARAQWGIARVALQRPEQEARIATVNDTLKLSPQHVEARIADASIMWAQGKEDRALHQLRVALGLEPTEEDQYLVSGKPAQAAGYSLLGFIHESRGRLHPAREAYTQALAADPSRVEALLGSGRVLLREKRYSDAQARFEAALSSATKGEDPVVLSGRKADLEAKLGIGRSLLALDRAQEAKTILQQLDAALPNDADVVRALGEAAQALSSPAEAERQFRKAIELAPKSFAGYLSLAQLFFKKGNAAAASEILNEAAAHVEETSEMRRMLGQSELARNRLDSAIHEFSRALELDNHDVDAMFGMATALRRNGDLDAAQKTLDEIGKLDPGYAGLAEQNGLLFEARGDFKRAVDAYRAALEKDPHDTSMLLRLGAAQVAAGDYDTAEQTLAKVARDMPNSAETEYFIGRVAFARGRTPDALTHFDRAVTLDSTKGEYHLYVARASFEMGNIGRALEEIQAALNFDPNLGDAYWVRGMARLRMGAVKDSLNDLGKALKLNPARTDAYAVQGDCYEQLRQLPDAIRAYRVALEKEPTRGEWWYRLAMLQADSGNRAESEGSVRRATELGDKTDPMPYWLSDAYRLAGEDAESRGDRTSAIRSYKRYLEIASPAAIDRSVVQKKFKAWDVELAPQE